MSSKGENSGGLMSSAGLVTYYDSESDTFTVEPLTIMLLGILATLVLLGVNFAF